ncbi:MAG: Na/Pi cotransporter family protein, partial [Verrucomicrobiota bacterium]
MLEFFQIVGSFGVFLFGLKVMSEGVQKAAGGRMRRILSTMTQNRGTGIFTGFTTTLLLQTSSATTVIVVGFVNAGLLSLIDSIGVIMGANLGTTFTAWMVAYVDVELGKLALSVIGFSIPVFFFARQRIKTYAEATIGFGLVLFGLALLKDAVPNLYELLQSEQPADKEAAQELLDFTKQYSGQGYTSIFLFLGIGVLITLIVQSSSVAMAITITLTINGWIDFPESCAIILGENIGTTITAFIASIGTTANAKRAARAHLLFNVIGVLWMLTVFYPFTDFAQWLARQLPDFLQPSTGGTGDAQTMQLGFALAIFHTLFNLANILLLAWFAPQIAALTRFWIRDRSEPVTDLGIHRLKFMTGGITELGELNLPEAQNATRELSELTGKMLDTVTRLLPAMKDDDDYEVSLSELEEMEETADEMTNDISEYLIRCSTAELNTTHAVSISAMLRITAELEEIADTIFRIGRLAERWRRQGSELTEEAIQGI